MAARQDGDEHLRRAADGAGGQDAAMRWYAEMPALRARQVLTDAAVLAWTVLWLAVGREVHRAVDRLGDPGRQLQQAGDGLTSGLSDAAERADDVPLVGDELRGPLDLAGRAGEAVRAAGQAQEQAVESLALLLATAVVVLPVLWALSRWLPPRLRWARDVQAVAVLRADVELLALRAATAAPLAELARLGPEPVGRWRRGEPGAAERLAALELARLGVRPERPR